VYRTLVQVGIFTGGAHGTKVVGFELISIASNRHRCRLEYFGHVFAFAKPLVRGETGW
jgi:hypothetical protein